MHILQRLAKKFRIPETDQSKDETYDFRLGFWVKEGKVKALNPDNPLSTKKNDVEIGEDMKGQ